MATASGDGPQSGRGLTRDEVVHGDLVALIPRMRRFAYALSGSLDEGDDLVQAACERAIAKIDQWQPGTRLDSWVFRIIRNIYLDRLRARSVRAEYLKVVVTGEYGRTDGAQDMEARLTLRAVAGYLGPAAGGAAYRDDFGMR